MADLIRLHANENHLGPSPLAIEAFKNACDEAQFYSGLHYADSLREKIAATLGGGLTEANIALGNGSGDVLRMIIQTYVLPESEIVIPKPSFAAYERQIHLHRGRIIDVPLKEYRIDLDAVLEAVTDKTVLIFLCNPNNPTGLSITHSEMADFFAKLPKGVVVVVDEAYVDFVETDDFPRMAEFVAQGAPVIVTRTFSKLYGLASMRVGFGFGPTAQVEPVKSRYISYDTGRMAFAGAEAALNDEAHVVNTIEMAREGKRYFYRELEKLGISYIKSDALFVLMTDFPMDAQALVDAVAEKGIQIRHTTAFFMPGYVRISIGTPKENEALINALNDILS